MDQAIEIAFERMPVGRRVFEPGDLFDPAASPDLTERVLMLIRRQRKILPLTRENYHIAISRRPLVNGKPPIGRGFNLAMLVELGIVDAPAGGVPAAKPAPEPDAPRERPAAIPDEAIQCGRFWLIPQKVGKSFAVNYDLVNDDGTLVRDQRFKNPASAQKYVDALPPPPPAATPAEGAKESDNGGHVQSGPEQPAQ